MPWIRYPSPGLGGAPAAASSSSTITSYTGGSSWPPMRFGHVNAKNPPSYSEQCHSPCLAQYSSSVDDAGNPGLLSTNHARKRARNSASSGESSKSTDHSRSRAESTLREIAQVMALVSQQRARQQRPLQVHVHEALPGVADPAVHLDGGLAHRAGSTRGVGLRHRPRIERVGHW